ncbi:MAG TPA: NAD(P)H-dependent oxidoreductase [Prolixibacteraceae bacterium]|nr:NAD(P)H-dependent oxidoreductase [Prolixibacteraceae bacterium]
MKLAIFNGSPRKTKSNSTILIQQFLKGLNKNDHSDIGIYYLADIPKNQEHTQKFIEADTVIIIFPLYTDAMPGQVKYFLETIEKMDSKGKNVGFIVQSGFPEAYHSIFIEKYLQKTAKRMGWNNLGTVIKGGVEGIQIMPPSMTKKLFLNFEKMGSYFAETGKFDPIISKKLRNPYRMNFFRRTTLRVMMLLGWSNFYWNLKLKENHAYNQRFAQPYLS